MGHCHGQSLKVQSFPKLFTDSCNLRRAHLLPTAAVNTTSLETLSPTATQMQPLRREIQQELLHFSRLRGTLRGKARTEANFNSLIIMVASTTDRKRLVLTFIAYAPAWQLSIAQQCTTYQSRSLHYPAVARSLLQLGRRRCVAEPFHRSFMICPTVRSPTLTLLTLPLSCQHRQPVFSRLSSSESPPYRSMSMTHRCVAVALITTIWAKGLPSHTLAMWAETRREHCSSVRVRHTWCQLSCFQAKETNTNYLIIPRQCRQHQQTSKSGHLQAGTCPRARRRSASCQHESSCPCSFLRYALCSC